MNPLRHARQLSLNAEHHVRFRLRGRRRVLHLGWVRVEVGKPLSSMKSGPAYHVGQPTGLHQLPRRVHSTRLRKVKNNNETSKYITDTNEHGTSDAIYRLEGEKAHDKALKSALIAIL